MLGVDQLFAGREKLPFGTKAFCGLGFLFSRGGSCDFLENQHVTLASSFNNSVRIRIQCVNLRAQIERYAEIAHQYGQRCFDLATIM